VRLHSIFLRKGCALPSRLNPIQKDIGENWTQVEELLAPVFDTMIRQAGWHFMWIQKACVRRGFGLSRKIAIDHALMHALGGVASRFNAAELDSVKVGKFLGFHAAKVTVQARQIQQLTSLDFPIAI
jgi:hypothetical protein